MRVIHDLAPEETIVATGKYHYFVEGQPTGQIETWVITRLPGGSEVVRADIGGGMSEVKASIVSHLQRTEAGRPSWLRIYCERNNKAAAAHYTFHAAGVHTFRQVEGHHRREEILDVADNYELDYQPIIAHDFVWRGYPEQANDGPWAVPLFSPDMWPSEDEDLLAGRSLRLRVVPQGIAYVEIPAGGYENARKYEVEVRDGEHVHCWFDVHGIPLRWVHTNQMYEFVLYSYKREET